ncbi:MAG: peptidoglycan editing factor PgeF [Rhodoferax sp.]|nr:peptidoglycan editing factor PgeF [Rhodoferax sp.]
MQTPDPDWLLPDWPAPPSVRAICTTRSGGISTGMYASMNLGQHVGDDPKRVHANRSHLQKAWGVRAVFMHQVHGSTVQELNPQSLHGAPADAACTTAQELACTVMVADCLPVLLCDAAGCRVAAAHAGWRGLLGVNGYGVLENTVAHMRQTAVVAQTGQQGHALLAWLGPCIGPRAFEVGEDVRQAFVAQSAAAQACFVAAKPGKWLADLPGLARQRLGALGITKIFGNDGSDAWCTFSNPSRFFSHRRDAVSGRMAACIWRA